MLPCRIHPHVFSFAVKRSQAADFRKQLLRRLKGIGDTKTVKFQIEEYAAFLTAARTELLAKLEASAASDIEAEVNTRTQACFYAIQLWHDAFLCGASIRLAVLYLKSQTTRSMSVISAQ